MYKTSLSAMETIVLAQLIKGVFTEGQKVILNLQILINSFTIAGVF